MPAGDIRPLSERGPDGRWVHTFRQSWIETFLTCPERARAQPLYERRESDATYTGTVVHAVIEDAINLVIEDDFWLDDDDLQDLFTEHWKPELVDDWIKRSQEGAERFGRLCVRNWGRYVFPELEPVATEVEFGPIVLYESKERIIQTTGTTDYVDQRYVGDWKTTSSKYKPWEKERWAIQPTVYLPALAELGHERTQWKFWVMTPEVQEVTLERSPEHAEWLVDQLISIAVLLEAELPVWPKRDQHALCSPLYCPHWDNCKGDAIKSASWVVKQQEQIVRLDGTHT